MPATCAVGGMLVVSIRGLTFVTTLERASELGLPRVRLGVRVALPHLRARYERLGYRLIEQRNHAVTTDTGERERAGDEHQGTEERFDH